MYFPNRFRHFTFFFRSHSIQLPLFSINIVRCIIFLICVPDLVWFFILNLIRRSKHCLIVTFSFLTRISNWILRSSQNWETYKDKGHLGHNSGLTAKWVTFYNFVFDAFTSLTTYLNSLSMIILEISPVLLCSFISRSTCSTLHVIEHGVLPGFYGNLVFWGRKKKTREKWSI